MVFTKYTKIRKIVQGGGHFAHIPQLHFKQDLKITVFWNQQ